MWVRTLLILLATAYCEFHWTTTGALWAMVAVGACHASIGLSDSDASNSVARSIQACVSLLPGSPGVTVSDLIFQLQYSAEEDVEEEDT